YAQDLGLHLLLYEIFLKVHLPLGRLYPRLDVVVGHREDVYVAGQTESGGYPQRRLRGRNPARTQVRPGNVGREVRIPDIEPCLPSEPRKGRKAPERVLFQAPAPLPVHAAREPVYDGIDVRRDP